MVPIQGGAHVIPSSVPRTRGSLDGLPLFPSPNQASDDAQQRGMLFAHAEVLWLEQADCLWRV